MLLFDAAALPSVLIHRHFRRHTSCGGVPGALQPLHACRASRSSAACRLLNIGHRPHARFCLSERRACIFFTNSARPKKKGWAADETYQDKKKNQRNFKNKRAGAPCTRGLCEYQTSQTSQSTCAQSRHGTVSSHPGLPHCSLSGVPPCYTPSSASHSTCASFHSELLPLPEGPLVRA